MPRTARPSKSAVAQSALAPQPPWDSSTELVGLTLTLQPQTDLTLPTHYTTELHSWFLDQVRRKNTDLSTQLHDGQSEKAFTIASLQGEIDTPGHSLRDTRKGSLLLSAQQSYQWQITALSPPVAAWMADWLNQLPPDMRLRSGDFQLGEWAIAHPATTYETIWEQAATQMSKDDPSLTFTFTTPTSFRRRGNHMPLPLPDMVFQSYLRRWNHFAFIEFDPDPFLDWIDDCVIILRHHLQSAKVAAGKQGSVTGFTGSIQYKLTAKAQDEPEYIQLFYALGQFAPYCATGHKTTFGLGQTRLGWTDPPSSVFLKPSAIPAPRATDPAPIAPSPTHAIARQTLLTQRIAELTTLFIAQRKRTGGDRASQIAATWATILARRELGESLQAIAQDLEMPYETVKTYVKLARRALNEGLG
jgi:CRISPR-associated endoribonuclease Cas6